MRRPLVSVTDGIHRPSGTVVREWHRLARSAKRTLLGSALHGVEAGWHARRRIGGTDRWRRPTAFRLIVAPRGTRRPHHRTPSGPVLRGPRLRSLAAPPS